MSGGSRATGHDRDPEPGADAAAGRGRAPAEEHVALLRRRAVALARVPRTGAARPTLGVLLFELGSSRYAMETTHLVRILTLRELTPLPGAAPPLFGLTHWRGTVLTLLDLRPLLGAAGAGVTDLGRVIVLDGEDRHFGIVVDRVADLTDLDEAAIRPLPPRDDAAAATLLRGMTDDGVLVVDAAAVVARFGTVRRRHSTMGRGG